VLAIKNLVKSVIKGTRLLFHQFFDCSRQKLLPTASKAIINIIADIGSQRISWSKQLLGRRNAQFLNQTELSFVAEISDSKSWCIIDQFSSRLLLTQIFDSFTSFATQAIEIKSASAYSHRKRVFDRRNAQFLNQNTFLSKNLG